MAAHKSSIKLAFTAVLGVFLMGGCFFIIFYPKRSEPVYSLAGTNRLVVTSAGSVDPAALHQMTWADIAPTAEAVIKDSKTREQVLAITANTTNLPVVYMRGLLLIANSEPENALAAFKLIAAEQIPSEHLYAPYRVQGFLAPTNANPFLPPLRKAIALRRMPALIEGRVEAQEGNLQASLQAYMRTDPALWASYDLSAFSVLMRHAGLANDFAAMIRSAQRSGRISPPMRTNIAQMITAAQTNQALITRFTELLKNNPAAQQLAVTGAIRQLEIRRKFMQKQYEALLKDHRDAQPLQLTDEAILLLTISAAREKETAAFDRWSQEMKRRNPTPEVEQWIQQLKAAIK